MFTQLTTRSRTSLQRLSKTPGLRYQAVIAFLVGATFGVQYAATIPLMGEMATEVNTAVFALTLTEIVAAFGVWLVGTTGMFILASFFPTRVLYGRLLRTTGWGLLPLVGAGVLQTAGRLYALRDAEPPEEPLRSGVTYEIEVFRPYVEQAASDPVFVATTLLAIPFVLVSGHLWRLGVEEMSDLGRRKSAAMAAIPTILALYWLLSALL